MERIIIFTDGAAKGNPGPGGWGTIVNDGAVVAELGGAAPRTTNNRMEMEAAIRGLERVQSANAPIAIYTDSTYLIQGITQWIHGWRRKGWKTAAGDDVLNRDLWERLAELVRGAGAPVTWTYVRGHTGVPGNERVDTIASEMALGNPVDLFRGPAATYPIDLGPPPAASGGGAKSRPKSSNSGKAYSYLSMVGGVAERHQTWSDCERRVRGVSGARFKKALSPTDEAKILAEWGAKLK